MRRREAMALMIAALPLRADSGDDAWNVVAVMAAALAEDNADGFMKVIDPKMPGYGDLGANIAALVSQADSHSSITPVRNEGDDATRTLELDWELRLTRKGQTEPRMERREQLVTIQFQRDRKKWLVLKIEPLSFFTPPKFG